MRRSALHRSVLALPFVLLSACGASHVQIKFHQLTRGDQYQCASTDKEEKCTLIPPVDPATEQRAGTTYFIAPAGCDGSFSQITIEDAGSSSPKMHVVCSPVEN
jgi:hypothetical protein